MSPTGTSTPAQSCEATGHSHAPLPDDSPVTAALAYAVIGWPVIPVWWIEAGRCACGDSRCGQKGGNKAGKHPIQKGWKDDATTDPTSIRRTWMRYPKAHIGVHVGKAGIIVVDVDPRNDGDATLRALEKQFGPLTTPVAAQTGGGGEHRIFAAPGTGVRIPGRLGTGIDVKHGDSYILVAPSGHASGGTYHWKQGCDPFKNASMLALPPAWVISGQHAGIAPVDDDDWAADIPREGIEETPENLARLRSALGHVFAGGSRADWRDQLFAIHSTGWDCAEEIAVEWSVSVPGLWEEAAFRNIWHSAKADRRGGRTFRSIFRAARQNGWRDPRQARPDTLGDVSNGRRFAERYRNRLLQTGSDRKWWYFDDSRWARCVAGEEIQAAKDIADDMVTEAANAFTREPTEPNKRNHSLALGVHRSAGRLRELVAMAGSEPGMIVPDPTAFDADPWRLGVQNGVVDLRAGTLLQAEPGHRISKQAGAAFYLDATCPQWLRFLNTVFGDAEVVSFIQRAAGYSLTGAVDEEKLFFCQGSGANGKSVFANVLCSVFGEYAVTVGSELLARNKHENEAARYKTRLQGARLALANEVGEGDTWDDHRVKELVSRERIAARALYGEAFDFMPSHKLWVRGNHKPGILDAGDGMWRRIVLIGFERQIPESERVADLDRRLLEAERDGILRWMVQGCLDWQQGGLRVPASIAQATAAYRGDSDVLGSWLNERCRRDPGERHDSAEVYRDFQQYIKDVGMIAPSRPAFVRRLGQRGIKRLRSNGVDYFLGLKLRNAQPQFEGVGEDYGGL